MGLFASITGSTNYPRASNDTSLRIFKSMIEPIAYYAPSVLCTRRDNQFSSLDQILAKAARMALHVPRSISSTYVRNRAGLQTSKERTHHLAKSYITSPYRSDSVKKIYEEGKITIAKRRNAVITPKTIIKQA